MTALQLSRYYLKYAFHHRLSHSRSAHHDSEESEATLATRWGWEELVRDATEDADRELAEAEAIAALAASPAPVGRLANSAGTGAEQQGTLKPGSSTRKLAMLQHRARVASASSVVAAGPEGAGQDHRFGAGACLALDRAAQHEPSVARRSPMPADPDDVAPAGAVRRGAVRMQARIASPMRARSEQRVSKIKHALQLDSTLASGDRVAASAAALAAPSDDQAAAAPAAGSWPWLDAIVSPSSVTTPAAVSGEQRESTIGARLPSPNRMRRSAFVALWADGRAVLPPAAAQARHAFKSWRRSLLLCMRSWSSSRRGCSAKAAARIRRAEGVR